MEQLIELGEKMNLEGEKLHEFVREQQAIEREESERVSYVSFCPSIRGKWGLYPHMGAHQPGR